MKLIFILIYLSIVFLLNSCIADKLVIHQAEFTTPTASLPVNVVRPGDSNRVDLAIGLYYNKDKSINLNTDNYVQQAEMNFINSNVNITLDYLVDNKYSIFTGLESALYESYLLSGILGLGYIKKNGDYGLRFDVGISLSGNHSKALVSYDYTGFNGTKYRVSENIDKKAVSYNYFAGVVCNFINYKNFNPFIRLGYINKNLFYVGVSDDSFNIESISARNHGFMLGAGTVIELNDVVYSVVGINCNYTFAKPYLDNTLIILPFIRFHFSY